MRRLAWASLFSLVYLAVHQLFDYYMNLPAVGFAFALTVGRLDALVPAASLRPDGRSPRPVAARAGRPGDRARTGHALARSIEAASADGQIATDAANRGDWAAALDRATAADAANPGMPPYLFTRGLALAHEGRTEEALAAIRQSAEIDDYPIAWLDVAALEAELGNEEAAAAALEQAMRIGFQNSQVDTAAVWVYLQLGDEAGAVTAARQALSSWRRRSPAIRPGKTPRSWPSVRRAALDEIYAEADPITAFYVALEAGELDEVPGIIERMPEQSRARMRRPSAHGTATPAPSRICAPCFSRVRWTSRPQAPVIGSPPMAASPAAIRPSGTATARPSGTIRSSGSAQLRTAASKCPALTRRGISTTSTGGLAPSDELVPGLPHLTLVPADEGYAQSASTSRSNSVS